MSGSMLRLHDVSVALGGRTIWSDATFEIPDGAMVAIIGPNGSGKTTLLQLLLGLIPPDGGSLEVLGATPRRGSPRIGYVPQNYTAANGDALRARDLVLLGLAGRRWGLRPTGRNDHARVDDALRAVDALTFADRRMSELSGGQQQRVAIAQALVSDPAVLVLDEPLANLDLRNQREIVALLAGLRVSRGIGVLVVVHDLNPLLSVLTGAIYLLDGHAHYAGVDQVVSEELLTHLYGTRVKVVRTAQGDLFTRGA
jgi:zinc/manganese transport system ATP-binding protein